MEWTKTLEKAAEFPGKFLENGGHAQQDIPAQHRLLNAGVMTLGWFAMDKLRDAMFGVSMKSEGEYVELKREEVSAPLRFLYKTIDWEPHSEEPEHQWKKLLYQTLPGIGAGVGAVIGSMIAFERNGRAQKSKTLGALEFLGLMDADYAAQYSQSMPLRALTAFFGTFSAASGLTFLYGMFLNNAFAASNGAKIFSGSLARGNMGPEKALKSQLDSVGSYVKEAMHSGQLSDAWSKQFVTRVLEPMFGELQTPAAQENAVSVLQKLVEKSYNKFSASGKTTEEIAKSVTDDLTKILGGKSIDKTLKTSFGLDPAAATLGNANPGVRMFNDFLSTFGLSKKVAYGQQAKPEGINWSVPAFGAAIGGSVAVAGVAHMHKNGAKAAAIEPTNVSLSNYTPKHESPDARGKTPAEFAYEAMELHKQQFKGHPPSAMLKWFGDAQLAVLPKNRMLCAIGLTSGLLMAGTLAKITTGYGLDKTAVVKEQVPTFLQGIYKIVKDFDPKGLRPRDRWIRYAQWGVYSLGGLIGIKVGTDFAYSNVYKKNSNPHFIEDYLPRVSMHQGETWSWLSAFAGIFGSSSGLFALPIPGLNYALGLAGRTTSMQDRNFMISGMDGMMSGATTNSYLRLREGLSYMCHYAVGNKAQTPTQFEFLAYTLLGPIFKGQLKTEHIVKFTEAVHEVRDKFWQDGGIPKENKKEALKAMREQFSGEGLELLLINMGLNPGTIIFDTLNGMTGKIGNLGVSDKVHKEQENYEKELNARLEKYVSEGKLSDAKCKWVLEGIKAAKQGKVIPEFKENVVKEPEPIIPSFAEKIGKRNLIKPKQQSESFSDKAQTEQNQHFQMAT